MSTTTANQTKYNEQQRLAQLRQNISEYLANWQSIEQSVLEVWTPVLHPTSVAQTPRETSVSSVISSHKEDPKTSLIRRRATSNTKKRMSLDISLKPEQIVAEREEKSLSPRIQPVLSPPQRKVSVSTPSSLGSRGALPAFRRPSNVGRSESEGMLPSVKGAVSPTSTPLVTSLSTPPPVKRNLIGENRSPHNHSSSSEELERMLQEDDDSEDEPVLAATADATLMSSINSAASDKELNSTVRVLTLRGRRQSLIGHSPSSSLLATSKAMPPNRRNSKPPKVPKESFHTSESFTVTELNPERTMGNEYHTPMKKSVQLTEAATPNQRETTIVYDRSTEEGTDLTDLEDVQLTPVQSKNYTPTGGSPSVHHSGRPPSSSSSTSSAERYL